MCLSQTHGGERLSFTTAHWQCWWSSGSEYRYWWCCYIGRLPLKREQVVWGRASLCTFWCWELSRSRDGVPRCHLAKILMSRSFCEVCVCVRVHAGWERRNAIYDSASAQFNSYSAWNKHKAKTHLSESGGGTK